MKEQDNQPKFERTALHEAVEKNNIKEVKRLLEEGKVDITAREPNDGYTPLHYAILKNIEIAKLLIDALKKTKQEINLQNKDGETPLHWAFIKGYVELTTLILDAMKKTKEEINPENKRGETPLHWAIKKGEGIKQIMMHNNLLCGKEIGLPITTGGSHGLPQMFIESQG